MLAIIVLVLKATIGIRVSEEEEETGLDQVEHAETAYSTVSSTMARLTRSEA